MSIRFLAMPDHDRTLAFDNAALTLHLNAVILEKDFWGVVAIGAVVRAA